MQNIKRVDVNRRTIVRTAAWSAPAVAVVAAAPAYAASGQADLSGSSMSSTPSRGSDGTVSVASGSVSLANSGGSAVEGISVSVSLGGAGGTSATSVPTAAPLGSITQILLAGQPVPGATGLGTGSVSFSLPAEVVTIAPGGTYPISLPLEFVTNEHRATTATVSVAPLNGGASTEFPPISFSALNVANLSQSFSTAAPTRSGSTVTVPPTTFKNVGSKATTGARVTIISSVPITKMQAKSFITLDLTATGVTFENGYAPGPNATEIRFRTGASGQLSNMAVGVGGEKTSSAPQLWTFANSNQVTFSTKIEPLISEPPVSSPVEGIGVQFQTVTV
jgi:hypothetical protein